MLITSWEGPPPPVGTGNRVGVGRSSSSEAAGAQAWLGPGNSSIPHFPTQLQVQGHPRCCHSATWWSLGECHPSRERSTNELQNTSTPLYFNLYPKMYKLFFLKCSPELQMLTSSLIGKWGKRNRTEVQSSSYSQRKGKPQAWYRIRRLPGLYGEWDSLSPSTRPRLSSHSIPTLLFNGENTLKILETCTGTWFMAHVEGS